MAGPGASPQLWDRQTVGLSLWELHGKGGTPLERCKPSKQNQKWGQSITRSNIGTGRWPERKIKTTKPD